MNLQKVLQSIADNRAKVCAKEYYIYRLLEHVVISLTNEFQSELYQVYQQN